MPSKNDQDKPEVKSDKKDIYYTCVGIPGIPCGKECVWTVGEQEFYEKKGLYQPRRCKDCAKKMRDLRGGNKQ